MKRWKNELVILFDLYMAYTSKWWWSEGINEENKEELVVV